MSIFSIIGLIAAYVVIVFGILISGLGISHYLQLSSFLIVGLSSFFIMFYAYPTKDMIRLMKAFLLTFSNKENQAKNTIVQLIEFSEIARRDGLLALDDQLPKIKNAYMRSGVQFIVDGAEPNAIQTILNNSIRGLEKRHAQIHKMLDTWSKLAPAAGLLGTVIGLVALLAQLSNKAAIGPSLSVALLTTLYGTILSNFLLIPAMEKLQILSEEEVFIYDLILEGLLAIQSGDNPRVLEEKLLAFFAKKEVKAS